MTITISNRLLFVGVALVLATGTFAMGFFGARRGVPLLGDIARLAGDEEGPLAESSPSARPEQLLLIYYAKSNCVWCNDPSMPGLLEEAMRDVARTAYAHDLGFVSMGVAMDQRPEVGLEYLARVGHFHQVSAGYGWQNAAAIDFHGIPSINSTPQLLVLRRTLEGNVPGDASLRTVQDLSVVVRKIGFDEIAAWVAGGSLLPRAALSKSVSK